MTKNIYGNMEMDNNTRIIFRPTGMQYKRLGKMLASGHYKHMSELIRSILEIGLDALEKKHN